MQPVNKGPQKWPPIIPVPRLSPVTKILESAMRAEHSIEYEYPLSGSSMQYPQAVKSAVGSFPLPKIGRGVLPLSIKFCNCASPQNRLWGTSIPVIPTRNPAIAPDTAARLGSCLMLKEKSRLIQERSCAIVRRFGVGALVDGLPTSGVNSCRVGPCR